MGAVTGMLGLAGGAGGTGFAGPQSANITNPTDPEQIKKAYEQSQQGLQNQQGLLQALQAQQGLQKQTDVFGQLQGVAAGTGPNPALAQLNQATGQNVANQAALMAGQRGAGANTGMMARQIGQQGANIQQQAAGQGATLQAQQQLAAMQQLGGMAGQMAEQQIGQTNANTAAQQAQHQALMNAQMGVNTANVQNQASINAANAGLANARMGQMGSAIGGLAQGVGSSLFAAAPKMGAEGGVVSKMADGGQVKGPRSKFGQFINNVQPQQFTVDTTIPATSSDPNIEKGMAKLGEAMMRKSPSPQPNISKGVDYNAPQNSQVMVAAEGGKVPALLSPGERYLPPDDVEKAKAGVNPMALGKKVPGKPKVGGAKNSYANDTIPATLEEGGLVLPRSVTQSKNPEWAAHRFVKEHMIKHGLKQK